MEVRLDALVTSDRDGAEAVVAAEEVVDEERRDEQAAGHQVLTLEAGSYAGSRSTRLNDGTWRRACGAMRALVDEPVAAGAASTTWWSAIGKKPK